MRTFCVCPGGRNAPLVEVLDALPAGAVTILSFFDERSAGFFALGRARRDGRPVAVVTTSGTAAAELLPAMVEAHYSSVPLVAVTADRPRDSRGTGAPQAIEQAHLFGPYATLSVDLESPDEVPDRLHLSGPSHLNVCFTEPLLGGWTSSVVADPADAADDPPGRQRATEPVDGLADVAAFLDAARAPLVIVGGLQEPGDRELASRFCRALGAPVLAEASSGIRSETGLTRLASGDLAARRGLEHKAFDSAIRIGDVPSFRVWRDLEASKSFPVLSVSRKQWRGLTHGTHVQVRDGLPLPLPLAAASVARAGNRALLAWDEALTAATGRLLDAWPGSEPALVRRLSEAIPEGSFVYLGNSLPIREWNQFATFSDRRFSIGENRGANGIDGQVASFLGWAGPGEENWAVLGDLTALYDLSALWALRHLDALRLRVVVVNNGGGRNLSADVRERAVSESPCDRVRGVGGHVGRRLPPRRADRGDRAGGRDRTPSERARDRRVLGGSRPRGEAVSDRCRLVALHGFLGRPSDWDGLAEYFPTSSVTALDLWALLEEEGVADWASMSRALDRALAVALPADDPRPAFLVAYSFGARLALASAWAASSATLLRGTCLVSCNPGLSEANRAAREARRESDDAWAQRILTWPEADIWRAWDAQPVFAGGPAAPSRGRLPASRETLARALTRFSLAGQPDFRSRLRAWGGPMLWVTGARDAKFSAIAADLSAGGVPAMFVTCDGAGHRVPWDDPPAFARAVRAWTTGVMETSR